MISAAVETHRLGALAASVALFRGRESQLRGLCDKYFRLAMAVSGSLLVNCFQPLSNLPLSAGVLRESVLHRYAQYCNVVRRRLLIDQQKQPVNIRDLDSGGRGRKFESSHPDQLLS